MPKAQSERAQLLAEIRIIGRQQLTADQQLFERYLKCPEAQAAAIAIQKSLRTRFQGTQLLHAPSILLPWLG